jgi:hypothetical protein
MNMNSNNGFEHHATPDELQPIEAALDRLGEHERDSAPIRLEQGVFLASYGKLRDQGTSVVAGRILPAILTRLRLAAAVGIIGAAAAMWLGYSAMFGGTSTGSTQIASTTGLEDDVNFVLDLRSSSDDLAILGDRIDTLFMDTSSVGDSLRSEPTMILLGDGAL